MQVRHRDRKQYFAEQCYTTEDIVVPYIRNFIALDENTNVLEIGCGEGGNLKPFLDIGCKVVGIDLAINKISNGKMFFAHHPNRANLTFIAEDIYNVSPKETGLFDLILMRDTLEHIHNRGSFLMHLKEFMKPHSKVFIAFPPWRMPFGGHQQICKNPIASKLPYIHLLPNPLYVGILKLAGESNRTIEVLKEIKETRIYLEALKKLISGSDFRLEHETYYLINPNYKIKFKLKPMILPKALRIPIVKDYFTTAYYGILSLKEE